MNYSWPWRSRLLCRVNRLTFEIGTHPHGAWVMLERVPSSVSKQIAHLRSGDEKSLSQRFQEVICIYGTAKASAMTTHATRKATGKEIIEINYSISALTMEICKRTHGSREFNSPITSYGRNCPVAHIVMSPQGSSPESPSAVLLPWRCEATAQDGLHLHWRTAKLSSCWHVFSF